VDSLRSPQVARLLAMTYVRSVISLEDDRLFLMRKTFLRITQGVATIAFALSFVAPVSAAGIVSLRAGDLIKPPDDHNNATTADAAIYYFGADGLRYVFPNSKTYFTWYSNFNGVKEVSAEQMGSIGIGGNVTYKPGTRMIKIESSPTVYAIDGGGARRAIGSEAVARALYGANWNHMIDDVPDAFFSNYPDGAAITSASDYSVAGSASTYGTIELDKDLRAPVEVTLNADGSFTPSSVTVSVGRAVRFTNQSGAKGRVASNPHPAHDGLPGFDSADLPAGLNYAYKFKRTGTFGFHNHLNPSMQGTVTVQ